MTQSQIDLFNAAESALNEAESKVRLLQNFPADYLLPSTAEKNPPMNAQAISETLINIKTALLWLREI